MLLGEYGKRDGRCIPCHDGEFKGQKIIPSSVS